jgi:hypothetical protein
MSPFSMSSEVHEIVVHLTVVLDSQWHNISILHFKQHKKESIKCYENIIDFYIQQILTLMPSFVSPVKQYFQTLLCLTIRIALNLEFLTAKIALITKKRQKKLCSNT